VSVEFLGRARAVIARLIARARAGAGARGGDDRARGRAAGAAPRFRRRRLADLKLPSIT
jgi:hypothetical protein